MQRLMLAIGSFLCVSALMPAASFAVRIEDQRISDVEAVANERLGTAVAADGVWAVIGATGDDSFAGSALMWGFASIGDGLWIPWGKLTADAPADDAQFGKVVAISNDVVVVGSPFWATQGHGAAYVFRLIDSGGGGSVWTFEQRLTPTLTESQSNAGWSVAVSDDVVVVAAYYSLVSKAYVYRFNGVSWVKEKDLPVTGTGAITVAVSGDVIAVESSTLEIFRYDSEDWVKEDDFGSAVSFALRGDDLLIGDSFDDGLAEDAGAAIVYRYDGADWVEGPTLRASDGAAGDRFGSKVSLTDGRALIFAAKDLAGVGSGYVFDREGATWTEIEKLASSDAAITDQFGSGIAVMNRAALIGAPNFTDAFTQEGLAYSWLLPMPEPHAGLLGFAALTALAALRRRSRCVVAQALASPVGPIPL